MQLFLLTILLASFSILVHGQEKGKSQDSTIKCVYETFPEFPGGMKALHAFLKKNLKYPDHKGKGSVFVKFYVNEDGSLSDLSILRMHCEQCSKISLEVIKRMPMWIPGKRGNKISKVGIVLPLKFEY